MTTSVIRKFVSFPINNFEESKQQILNWGSRFGICCFFDNHHYLSPYNSYECILAAGAIRTVRAQAGDALQAVKKMYDEEPDWLFGHFGYDLKNEVELLHSAHPDNISFPDAFFFVPQYIIRLSTSGVSINSECSGLSPEKVYQELQHYQPAVPSFMPSSPVQIKSRFTRNEYIDTIKQLQQHIVKGDCYEINFCQEFYAEEVSPNPLEIYRLLQKISPNPFSAFYKIEECFLLCASPERYIKKTGDRVISQPIKGTWVRNTTNEEADGSNKQKLYTSEKDRAENVMIVDLVRNDLSKICKEGSVSVDELYGIYSFPQMHQMISTISGKVASDIHWTDIIRATFPMGSMTGAPKKRVMELIEKYERTKRGIFSGTIGYITPEGDFDFNVVIRSILMNTANRYLAYQVGSAITFSSDAEKEYDECLLKAAAIQKVLQASSRDT